MSSMFQVLTNIGAQKTLFNALKHYYITIRNTFKCYSDNTHQVLIIILYKC